MNFDDYMRDNAQEEFSEDSLRLFNENRRAFACSAEIVTGTGNKDIAREMKLESNPWIYTLRSRGIDPQSDAAIEAVKIGRLYNEYCSAKDEPVRKLKKQHSGAKVYCGYGCDRTVRGASRKSG